MKAGIKSVNLTLALVLLGVTISSASDDAQSSSSSLGEIARELKAQKTRESKPAKVFTNDNLEPIAALDLISEKEPPTSPTTTAAPILKAPSTPSHGHNGEYYRAQIGKLRAQLETDQRELDVLQQKLGQNQMQYYGDPNKSLQQQYSRADVTKLQAEIDAKKDQVAGDNKAIDDLRDQLRHEDGDPGWLR